MSILKLIKRFPTEESCLNYLESIRFKKHNQGCPYCGCKTKLYSHTTEENGKARHRMQCGACKRSFKVTVNTIFHNTKLDIRKWFYIISLMMDAKKGLSACQIARDLDMNRPTVWKNMQKIRLAMNENEQREMIQGIFEMDEAEVEVKDNNNDDSDKGGKAQLSAIKEKGKGGKIRVQEIDNRTHFTLLNAALMKADYGSEIHTDGHSSYVGFKDYFNHKFVNHSKGEYVSSEGISTNGVDGFWSLLKRGIKGQFHHISRKYLTLYINEFQFRYNNKNNGFNLLIERCLGL